MAFTVCLVVLPGLLPKSTRASENVASGKAYRLDPAPNYKACTEPGDAIQLTDGVKKSSHWLHLSTVGWKDQAVPPSVRIDLGSIEPIEEVRIHTVGGGHAGVYLPSQILLRVSDHGETYHVAHVLDRSRILPPQTARRVPQVLRMESLQTRGRFVHITFVANKRYVFLDEVEVLRGTHDAASVTFESENRFREDQVQAVLRSVRAHGRLGEQLQRLTRASAGHETSAALRDEIAGLVIAHKNTPSFLASVVARLQVGVHATRGRWLAGRLSPGLFWHPANPMVQHKSENVFEKPAIHSDRLLIEGWRGETESAAFNLINGSPKDVRVTVSRSPLRSSSGQMENWGDRLQIRVGTAVETPGAGVVGDALVLLGNGPIKIAAGNSAQFVLTARIRDLEAGEYEFAFRLDRPATSGEQATTTVPGRLTVRSPEFPQQTSLHSFNWGYLSRLGLDRDALRLVVADLESHHTNVYTVPGTELPQGRRLADGSMQMDFGRFDRALERYPNARRYLFWWGYKEGRVSRHSFGEFMSVEWQAAMREYLVAWVAHLKDRGLSYDRFAMYPFDESLSDEFLKLARFIKQVDPRIAIFANSVGKGQVSRVDAFSPYIDIWCLPERKAHAETVRKHLRQTSDAEIWRYNATGDAKSLSPYGYYRLQPWRAWAARDTGCAFWVYATGRDRQNCNGWDDFTCGRGRWSVVYDGADAPVDVGGEPLVPSRRWEAWREGIEDYEYLERLSSLIGDAEKNGVAPATCTHVRSILAEIVADVLAKPDDADKVYEARRRLTTEIVRLRKILDG